MSNRPDWCPADVWASVEAYSRANEREPTMRKVQEFAARLVIAERERCSKIAESYTGMTKWGNREYGPNVSSRIAHAIRLDPQA